MTAFIHGGNVRANGIRQHYLRYGGKGYPLLLVPGITSPAITWGFVAERLATRYDVHVLDVRGRGLSEARPDLDYGLDAMAADAAAFAEAMDFKRYDFLGHSMGARVGIRMARGNPKGLRRMALIDPPVTGPGRRAYPAPLSWYVDSIRLMRDGADWQALKPFSPSWTEDHLRLRAEWLHTCDEAAIVKSYNDFHDTDIHADLPHVKTETLVVTAGKGGVILDEDVAELARLKPDLKFTRVETAGHMIPWDDFDGFFAALDGFLDPSSA